MEVSKLEKIQMIGIKAYIMRNKTKTYLINLCERYITKVKYVVGDSGFKVSVKIGKTLRLWPVSNRYPS